LSNMRQAAVETGLADRDRITIIDPGNRVIKKTLFGIIYECNGISVCRFLLSG